MAQLIRTDSRRLSTLALSLVLCACTAQPPASMATPGTAASESADPRTAAPRASAVARADTPAPLVITPPPTASQAARPSGPAAEGTRAPAESPRTTTPAEPMPAAVPAPLVTSRPSASATATSVAIRTFQNPVIGRDFPDPDVIRSGGHFYAYATNSGGINVQVARSVDLVTWEPLPDALPALPAWARAGRTWAPDVTRTPQGWVLYFTAWHAASGRQCIGAATAASPVGPFHPLATPLVCPLASGGAIDASSFVDVDGGRYLVWKNDGNCCAFDTYIYAQPMTPDGLAFAAGPTPLIRADRPWEGGVVEAPTVYRRGGIYHLFYSANGYEGAAYAIGHAQGVSLAKPLAKDAAPLARTGAGITGPGGQDLIEVGGATWFAYHRWADGGAYRAMDLGRVAWEGDRPLFTPTREPQPVP